MRFAISILLMSVACGCFVATRATARDLSDVDFTDLGYTGKSKNKPVAELELMTDFELNKEAVDVCMWATAINTRAHGDAVDYLQLIQRVARKQHSGKTPTWATQVYGALYDSKKNECFWFDSPGAKSASELEGLSNYLLRQEAVRTCRTVNATHLTSQPKLFLKYLEVIKRVAKKRYGENTPAWASANFAKGECPSDNDEGRR